MVAVDDEIPRLWMVDQDVAVFFEDRVDALGRNPIPPLDKHPAVAVGRRLRVANGNDPRFEPLWNILIGLRIERHPDRHDRPAVGQGPCPRHRHEPREPRGGSGIAGRLRATENQGRRPRGAERRSEQDEAPPPAAAAGDDSERGPKDRRQGEGQRSERCTAGKRRDHGAETRGVVCIVVWPSPRNADVARDARQLQSPASLTARWWREFRHAPPFTPLGGGERRHCRSHHSCLKARKDAVRAAVESAERD